MVSFLPVGFNVEPTFQALALCWNRLETSATHQTLQAKNIPYHDQPLLIKSVFSLLASAVKTG